MTENLYGAIIERDGTDHWLLDGNGIFHTPHLGLARAWAEEMSQCSEGTVRVVRISEDGGAREIGGESEVSEDN